MLKCKIAALGAALWIVAAAPVFAEIDIEAVQTCFDAKVATGEQLSCVETAHAECASYPAEAMNAALLCYTEAKDTWSGAIGQAMTGAATSIQEGDFVKLQINAKYDLLGALQACDRNEELAIAASDLPSDVIAFYKAQCQSMTVGNVYVAILTRIKAFN